ncbi:MAG TPA: glycosyltransferase family 4 protein, partial [Candidatus Nanoarchaeia archaeon]|nr:glycosyltransferase family 4 protein [Candidatus Nanoarchaeia archaeon]
MKTCAIYYRKTDDGTPFHYAHKQWIQSLKPEAVTAFTPNFLNQDSIATGFIGQVLSFAKGLVVPSADVYILEGIACLPSVAFKKGKKIVINSDVFVRNLSSMSGLRKRYALWLLSKADAFVSTSEMMKDLTVKYSKKPQEVVYPQANLEAFYKIKPQLGSNNLCAIGLSVFPKGTDIAIDTYELYKKTHSEAKLFVCGEDSYRSEIDGLKGIVAPGRVDIKKYLAQSAININTSRHDSFGVSVMEAMAAGVIPIVSDKCGAKNFVAKVDKKLVVPLDAKKFAERASWI